MRPNLINRLKEEWSNLDPVDPLRGLIADAIDALAEQTAQQEPVAWRSWNDHDGYGFWETKHEAEPWCAPDFFAEPLYTSPPASKPWVGLTDEQITAGARALCKQMAEGCGVDVRDQWQLYSDTFKEDAKAVLEAAHGIKGDA